jgi:hypothetical protein
MIKLCGCLALAAGTMQRFVVFLIFLLCFGVYLVNFDPFLSGDMNSNSVFALNVLEYRTIFLDNFVDSHIFKAFGGYSFGKGLPQAPGAGHVTLAYPVGVAVFTFPIYAVFYVYLKLFAPAVSLLSVEFEPYRIAFSHIAASFYTAGTAALFFLICRDRFSQKTAIITTLCLAFATSQWGIVSQSLLQQGVSGTAIIGAAYLLLRAARNERAAFRLLLAAGAVTGLLFLIRPTNLAFMLALLTFATFRFGRRSLPFICTFAIGCLLSIAWNWYFFASTLGAGIFQTHAYHFSAATFVTGFLGLTLSPNHGAIFVSPLLVLAIGPMLAAIGALSRMALRWDFARGQAEDFLFVLLLGAGIVLLLNYSFNPFWSGAAYGARYLSETMPIAVYYLNFFVERLGQMRPRRKLLATIAFVALVAVSVFDQFTVMVAGHKGFSAWGAIPISNMDAATDKRMDYLRHDPLASLTTRAWSIRDGFVMRAWRGVYYNNFVMSYPISVATNYANRCRATILSAQDLEGSPIEGIRLTSADRTKPDADLIWDLWNEGRKFVHVTVRNDGEVPLYGYQTGLTWGFAAMVNRVVDADGRTVFQSGSVYVSGIIKPGETGIAIGSMEISTTKGRYDINGRMAINGLGFCGEERHLGAVTVD